jgi:hypothetical protein
VSCDLGAGGCALIGKKLTSEEVFTTSLLPGSGEQENKSEHHFCFVVAKMWKNLCSISDSSTF